MARFWILCLMCVLSLSVVAPAEEPPPPAVFGHLQVNVNAPGARVFVDGAFWGEASPGKPLNLRHVGAGEVVVRVEAPGRQSVSKPFRLVPEKWTQAVLVLPPDVRPDTLRADSVRSNDAEVAPEEPAKVSLPPEVQLNTTGKDSVLSNPSDIVPFPQPKAEGMPPSLPEPSMNTEVDGMVYVPSGAFRMGSDKDDEKPIHTVYVDGFWMDRYEVTVMEFMRFQSGYEPSAHSSCDTCPATVVTWQDAVAYCESLGKRLPSEAEWEKACRGPEGHTYAWGEEVDRSMGVFGLEWKDHAVPVGSFSANGYGLYEMSGNVWEWVQDYYDAQYYRRSPDKNPGGPDKGKRRVIRGGAWYGGDDNVRCSRRFGAPPDRQSRIIGFRCVR